MKKSKEELTTKEEVKMTEEKFKKQQYEYDKRSVMMAHSPALVPQLPQDIFKKIFQEKSNMNSII